MGIVSLSKESLDYLLNDTRFVCFLLFRVSLSDKTSIFLLSGVVLLGCFVRTCCR